MEDSSQNPYIPEESEAIRQKVYERQSPLGRVVKWSLIITIIVAVLVGAGLFFIIPRTSAVDDAARTKLADVLQPPDQMLKRIPIESELGFKLDYDNRVYSSYAEVGDATAGSDGSAAVIAGETYENNELRVNRAYNYVRIRPIESVESSRALQVQPPELEIFATISDKDLTQAKANAENRSLSDQALFVKLDTDKRLAKKVADDKTVVSIEAAKPVSAKIGNVDYQKVRFTTTNENYRIENVRYDDCYYTIQNKQPYSVCISNVRPTNVSAASLVERVFDSLTYQISGEAETATDSEKSSYVLPLARLAQATVNKESSSTLKAADTNEDESDDSAASGEAPLITVTPQYYSDANSLKAIAKNQPSVVRIGTLYCTDLTLKYESGETATTLTDACVGNVASGAIVSKDGHVATTGHAIKTQKKAVITGYINFAPDQKQMLDRLQRVLDYLLKAKIILQSDADYLKTGAAIGDQEALAKVENIASIIPDNFITPVKEEYTYAVQPTDKPIVVNRTDTNKPAFAYSDSVLKATEVASNYDATKSVQEKFDSSTPATDIGLLKIEGEYPAIPLASNKEVKANETLNIVGYPAYTDSSLSIDRLRNAPVATVTKVEQAYEKDGGQLIQTNLPILPGNDGAPALNASGELIGFAVYGLSYCPNNQCFANGTVRSVSELIDLLDESNTTLATSSNSQTTWRSGVDEFFKANYTASQAAFSDPNSTYTYNRWAEPAAKLAASLKGSGSDTSLMNQLQILMLVVLAILAGLTVLLSALFALHKRRINSMQVGLYGAAEAQSTIPAVPQLPSQQPVPPIQTPLSPSPGAFGRQSYAGPPTEQPPIYNQQPSVPQQPVQPQQPNQPPIQPAQNSSEDPFYK